MDEIGGFLGWVTVVCYLVSICTFIVKRINQFLISGLPRESKVRQYFSIFMKYIIKYHMYFGVGAGAFAVIHYFVQTSSGHDSLTGTILAASMVITVLLGAVIKMIKGAGKKKILPLHRTVVAFVLVMGILHLVMH